jgi:hypothetical protein
MKCGDRVHQMCPWHTMHVTFNHPGHSSPCTPAYKLQVMEDKEYSFCTGDLWEHGFSFFFALDPKLVPKPEA